MEGDELYYTWNQEPDHLQVFINVGFRFTKNDVNVILKKRYVNITIKEIMVFEGDFSNDIKEKDFKWIPSINSLHLFVFKKERIMWKSLLDGEVLIEMPKDLK